MMIILANVIKIPPLSTARYRRTPTKIRAYLLTYNANGRTPNGRPDGIPEHIMPISPSTVGGVGIKI